MNLQNKNKMELVKILKKYELAQIPNNTKKKEILEMIHNVDSYIKNKQKRKSFFDTKEDINLNEEQKKIVYAPLKTNMRVIASAGSGKTTTILYRIKFLIDNGIDPQKILLCTFNVDACQNMKDKIKILFGFTPNIQMGTIDSIACKFYFKYFKRNFAVSISEYSKYFLNYLRSDSGFFITSLYDYVFFDEFQDVNETQFQILKTFHDNGSYISVIGDDAQNIYQFRGSDIKFILNLELYFDNLSTFFLHKNYRSTPEIINLANKSISFNSVQIPKQMIPTCKSIDTKPSVHYFSQNTLQNNFIISSIFKYIEKGYSLDKIAVISRLNYSLKNLEEDFEKYNSQTHNFQKIKYVSLITDNSSDTKPKIKPNHITLTTIHKSKGLEWDVVFILDCDDNKFPSETDKNSIQEERRLFYVAVTRAKLFLHFCLNGFGSSFKITRFIQEIDKDLYLFDLKDTTGKKLFDFSDSRNIKWQSGVTEILPFLNEKELQYLRENNIIPPIEPSIQKIHSSHNINPQINDYYLHSDFGEYIDRYITRSFGILYPNSKGLIDYSVFCFITNNFFTKEEAFIFKKYEFNFNINFSHIFNYQNTNSLMENIGIYLEKNILTDSSKFNNDGNFIKKIDYNDLKILRILIKKILFLLNKYSIDFHIIFKLININKEIPQIFCDKIKNSYNFYNNPKYDSSKIKYHIYNISTCSNILNGRKRLLHREIFDYLNMDDAFFDDIDKFLGLIDCESTILCKKMVKNIKYDILGEIDLLIIKNNNVKIIDFKCSQSETFKFEWFLQLLTYCSILKLENPVFQINFLEIYNPLMGEIYTFDINGWDCHEKFLEYLLQLRILNITKNKFIKEEDSNEKSAHLLHSTLCSGKKIYLNEETKKESDLRKKYLFNLKNYFGNDFKFYWKYFNQISLENNDKHNNLVKMFHKYSSNKYIILDTETTGLLPFKNPGEYYNYMNLDKNKECRLIQICWIIVDEMEDKIIKTRDFIVKPNNFKIMNSDIHGITDKIAENGISIDKVFDIFHNDIKSKNIKNIICHNINFDINVIKGELFRKNRLDTIKILDKINKICTLKKSINIKINGFFKPRKLIELYRFYFNEDFDQHNARNDVMALYRIITAHVSNPILKKMDLF